MGAAALALTSSLLWGFADFGAGLRARVLPTLAVAFWAQVTGLVLAAAAVVFAADDLPAGGPLLFSCAAGVCGGLGLLCFYRALATGKMSVVAPIVSVQVAIPVVVGLVSGDSPAALALVGLALAVVGVQLAARERDTDPDAERGGARVILLALAAALGIGTFVVLIKHGAAGSPEWAVVFVRLSAIALFGAIFLATRRSPAIGLRGIASVAPIGLADAGANLLLAIATTIGLLSVVGVLGSLYALVTVALAQLVLHERLRRVQVVGIAVTVFGVVLIGAGQSA